MMTQRLSLIATRGTDRLETPIQVEQPTINRLMEAMTEASPPTQILRASGFFALRNRAGYTPDTDSRPLASFLVPDEVHDPVAYSPKIVRMLSRIHKGSYPQTYREWLHFVTLDNRTFPYEALPMMLSLATRYADTRKMTKRIIGSRGRWLVEHTTHRAWDWAKTVKPAKRPRLTKYEKQEARIIDRLAVTRYRRIPLEATFEMQTMTFPWSKNFSRVLAETFERSLQSGAHYQASDIQQKLEVLQWSIHPQQTKRIASVITAQYPYEAYIAVIESFLQVMAFRHQLRQVFESSK